MVPLIGVLLAAIAMFCLDPDDVSGAATDSVLIVGYMSDASTESVISGRNDAPLTTRT
jgi:hypothetical protein